MENSYGIIVGQKIRHARKQKKLSMKQLGKLVNLHESTVSRYEKGEISTLDIEKLKEFAKALNVPADYLAGWDNLNSLDTLMIKLNEIVKDTYLDNDEIDAIVDYAKFIISKRKKE